MIRILFGLADVMAIWIALLAAYYIRFHTGLIPIKEHQSLSLYLYSLLVSTPLYLVLLAAMGNYQERHGKLSHYERQTLIRTLVVFYLLCLSLTFLIHTQEHSRATILLTFFINLILLLLFRKAIISLQVRQWKNGENVSRILLIGTAEDTIQEMALAISKSRESGYQLAGSRLLHRDPIDLHTHETDRLILTGDLSFSEIADIVLITPAQIRIDFVPAYHIFLRSFPFKEQIGEFPLIPLNQQLFSDWNSVLKRVLDISVSATLLLIFFPFMALIALLIRMSYGSPILYRQERVGQNGRPFTLYKFRTMKPDAEKQTSSLVLSNKQAIFKWKDDPRVENAFARFLRRTALDEFPQLWNVLEGSMSLVGPRPATVELVKNYSPQQKIRLAIQPGLTGLQQVECRGTDSIEEVLKYDLQYIQEQSIWLDFAILIKTIPTLLFGKGVH